MTPTPFKAQVIYRRRPPQVKTTTGELGPNGFPARVKYLREMAGITLRDQDRYAALTANHSQAIEAGRRSAAIEARIVGRLARVYGCTMDWLWFGDGLPPSAHDVENAVDAADAQYRDAMHEVERARAVLRGSS